MAYDDVFGATKLREGPKNALSISFDVDAKTKEANNEDALAILLHTPEADEENQKGHVDHSHIRLHRNQAQKLNNWCRSFRNEEEPGHRIIADEKINRLAVGPGSNAPLNNYDSKTAILYHAPSLHSPQRYHIPLDRAAMNKLTDWLTQFINDSSLGDRYRKDIERNKNK